MLTGAPFDFAMIVATIDRLGELAPLIEPSVYERIRLFLAATNRPAFETVEILGGTELIVRVLRLKTKLREDCRFETHREYTDLQCVLGGGELIDWAPRDDLKSIGEYDPAHDVSFYETHAPTATLEMKSGLFAVFRGEDAHRPQIALEGFQYVEKFVFKIHNSQFRQHK